MKKILLFISLLYHISVYGQWGNTGHIGIPIFNTAGISGNVNSELWINSDSSKLQFKAGGTVFTVGGSSGGGSSYSFTNSLVNTSGTVTLVNDNASPGNNMLYGTNVSGTLGWYAQPAGISGLTSGIFPVATSSTAIGNSNLMTYAGGFKFLTGTSLVYATMIGDGSSNFFRGAINSFNDSSGYSAFGGTTQWNSSILNVNGASALNGNVFVGSTSTTTGMKLFVSGTTDFIGNLTTSGPLELFVNAGNTIGLTINSSGKSTFLAPTTSTASINLPSGTTPTSPSNGDLWWNGTGLYFYNGSSNVNLLAGASTPTFQQVLTAGSTLTGNNTVVLGANNLIFQGGQVYVGPNGGTQTWNPSTQAVFGTGGGTLNDATTSGSGTVTNVYDNTFTGSTLTATNTSITYTNGYTVFINQQPTAGSNVSITNSYALGLNGPAIFQSQFSTVSEAIYNWQTITSGTTATINNTQTNFLLNLSSLAATFTVTLPSAPVDGQIEKLFFGGTISGGTTVVTALTVSPNAGQTIVQSAVPTTALSGNCYIYQYNKALSIWYRQQ